MIQLLKDKFLFLFVKFRARRGLWLMFLILPSFFFVPLWQFVVSFFVWRISESIYLGIYHEFHVHKLLKPRWAIIEILGYWRLVSFDFQSPFDKILYHTKHHMFYETDRDPTYSKMKLTPNIVLYCLDISAPVPPASHNFDANLVSIEDTKLYRFFQKYWAWICAANIIVLISLLPFWTFIAWFIFPLWMWTWIGLTIDWMTHKLQKEDKNWFVLFYGTQCWHRFHHKYVHTQTKPDYGPGIWKWLNIDFYVQSLTFKQIKD